MEVHDEDSSLLVQVKGYKKGDELGVEGEAGVGLG
jgi:hypothetical protein